MKHIFIYLFLLAFFSGCITDPASPPQITGKALPATFTGTWRRPNGTSGIFYNCTIVITRCDSMLTGMLYSNNHPNDSVMISGIHAYYYDTLNRDKSKDSTFHFDSTLGFNNSVTQKYIMYQFLTSVEYTLQINPAWTEITWMWSNGTYGVYDKIDVHRTN